MTYALLNELKEELAKIERKRLAIEEVLVAYSPLPPPRVDPPDEPKTTRNGQGKGAVAERYKAFRREIEPQPQPGDPTP